MYYSCFEKKLILYRIILTLDIGLTSAMLVIIVNDFIWALGGLHKLTETFNNDLDFVFLMQPGYLWYNFISSFQLSFSNMSST